jgi:hypothetical protein
MGLREEGRGPRPRFGPTISDLSSRMTGDREGRKSRNFSRAKFPCRSKSVPRWLEPRPGL